jgi:hypothetical protein
MATSRCPRSDCNGSSFEMKELKVKGSAFRLWSIQCASCGAVVATQEFFNIGAAVERVAKKLGVTL